MDDVVTTPNGAPDRIPAVGGGTPSPVLMPRVGWLASLHARWQRARQRMGEGMRTTAARRPWLTLARWALRPLPDRLYLAIGHLVYFGTWPDYRNPRTFNEHIQAYMLRSRNPLLKLTADKLSTREYIAREAGPQYLVPLLGVWVDADEVPLAELPRPCVLKASVGSGMVIMLREDTPYDERRIRRTFDRWMRRDYSKLHREWCYSHLPHHILAEAMLIDVDGQPPADYKAYVIGGKLRFIQVDRGRFTHHTRNLYSPEWDLLSARLTLENHAPDPAPPRLAEMIAVAEKLARPFEFLRTDFYVMGDKLYIGELTNYPGAGFEKFFPSSYSEELGAMWEVR